MRYLLLLTLFLISASTTAVAATNVRFINDWKWEGQAAPLLLAMDRGFFTDEGLRVTLEKGSGSLDAIPRVASGEFHLGSADINSLVKWRVKNPGIDMKAVYIIYNSPPFAVLGRRSLGVIGPQDLIGRTVGAPSRDGAFAQWPAFAAANGLRGNQVNIRDVGFPVRESMLAAGNVQAITGYSFSSYLTLANRGVPEKDISLMLMSDFGLELYGNAIIVNPEFLQTHPDQVRAFLRAAVRGYQETIANPAEAVAHALARAQDADPDIELRRLLMAIGHHIVTDEVRIIGLGDVVGARLDASIAQLDSIHNFSRRPRAEDIFDDQFLPGMAARRLPEWVLEPAPDLSSDANVPTQQTIPFTGAARPVTGQDNALR